MTISATVTARNRMWRGYDDPGLPSGMWMAWLDLTGDASGGDSFMSVVLENATPSKSGRFFNLEALELSTTQSGGVPFNVIIINMSEFFAGAITNRNWTAPTLQNDFNANSALPFDQQLKRPIFLGSQDIPETPAQIQFVSDNFLSEIVSVRAEGYIWEGRSVQSQGGLRRPVDSLYG